MAVGGRPTAVDASAPGWLPPPCLLSCCASSLPAGCIPTTPRMQTPHLLQRLVCPREVVWLNGAPGSGKGTVGAGDAWRCSGRQAAPAKSLLLAVVPLLNLRCRHEDTAGAGSVHQRPRPQPTPASQPACAPTPSKQNMPFIMKSRGLSRAIGMSQLLDTSPDIKVGAGGWVLARLHPVRSRAPVQHGGMPDLAAAAGLPPTLYRPVPALYRRPSLTAANWCPTTWCWMPCWRWC